MAQFFIGKTGPEMEKIFEVLSYKPKIKNTTGIDVPDLKGDIEFVNVSFQYPGQEDVGVIKNMSFSIQQGDYIAFVGMSGCGKSTIIKLIERFYDVHSGVIKIGGYHI